MRIAVVRIDAIVNVDVARLLGAVIVIVIVILIVILFVVVLFIVGNFVLMAAPLFLLLSRLLLKHRSALRAPRSRRRSSLLRCSS